MASGYYAPGAARAQKVESLFARIAPRYDLINDLQSFGLHRWWKRRVVQLAGLDADKYGLDVCCGTGDLAFRLAQTGAGVYGLDFCAPMLEVAARRKTKLVGKHLPPLKVEFIQGDALQLPFPDDRFDVVTVAYGLRNLSDWRAGLGEMYRVTRPGGRLLVLDFGKPDQPAWRWLYFQYLRLFVPVLGKIFCGDAAAYAYILESLQNYPAQHGVAQALRELECREVKICNLLGGVMTINVGVK